MREDTHSASRGIGSAGEPTRRDVLRAGVLAGSGLVLGWPADRAGAATQPDQGLAFFVISDTHVLARRDDPARIDADRLALNDRLIDTLNELPGQRLPSHIGGGRVAEPKGVIHLGDMVDSGDKLGGDHERMTDTEWQAYAARYGVTGTEGRLRYPIYEIHGNHDSPRHVNVTIEGLRTRNRKRHGLAALSTNGMHYSWDWGGIHFVALGSVVGPNEEDLPISRYDSHESLGFLTADLRAHVGDSGRPVILMQHVDLQRYSVPCDEGARGGSRAPCCDGMRRIAWHSRDCTAQAAGISLSEWSACDVRAYHRAIQPYNVVAIFHGHLHARRIDRWDGRTVASTHGVRVFGARNAGSPLMAGLMSFSIRH